MKRVFITSVDDTACGLYRIKEPYYNIKSDIEFTMSNKADDFWKDDNPADAILVQRPTHPAILPFIADAKKMGVKIVVETDDHITDIPFSNPARLAFSKERLWVYTECLKLADHIHTTTPELAKVLGKKSVVFLNAINLKKYELKKKRTKSVGWFGSNTHADSLLLIKPVVKELARMEVVVTIMGKLEWLNSIFEPNEYINLIEGVPLDSYFVMPQIVDVFLTPLPNTLFNSCKSELKCLESGAWGVPCVSSNVAPFKRFHDKCDGNIIVKKERLKNWMDAILSLLDSEERWEEQSDKSLNGVKEHYDLEKINKEREIWWTNLLK